MAINRVKYLFVVAGLLCACSPTHEDDDLLTGDLFFSAARYGSFYNLPDSVRERIEFVMDTVNVNTADSSSRAFIDAFQRLKDQQMLYKPYVDIKLAENSYVKLYLDSADYDRIKSYKRKFLQGSNKKVVIKAHTRQIGNLSVPLLYCTGLVEVKAVEGETLPRGNKFSIDDYN